jgi:hypothetical protein
MRRLAFGLAPLAAALLLAGTAWGSAVMFEVRAGYFVPAGAGVHDVYKNGLTFGVELTIPVAKGLCAWAGIDYFDKTGKLTFTKENTTIRIMPLFAGLKLQSMAAAVRPYAAAAAGCFFYKEANIIGTASGQSVGVLGQLGLLVKIRGRVWLDISTRFAWAKFTSGGAEPFTTQLGGFQGGLGAAVLF